MWRFALISLISLGALAKECPSTAQVCAPDFGCYPLSVEHPDLERFKRHCEKQKREHERCLYGVRVYQDYLFVWCGPPVTPVLERR